MGMGMKMEMEIGIGIGVMLLTPYNLQIEKRRGEERRGAGRKGNLRVWFDHVNIIND